MCGLTTTIITNNELFYLHSADGSGRRNILSLPAVALSGNYIMTILDINFTPYVPTTLLGLLGLISGYLFFYFRNKNDNKLKEIQSASRKDRIKVIEMSLNELGVSIDTANLDATQKYNLIKGLLRTKTNRYLIISITAIILSGFITFLIWSTNNTNNLKNKTNVIDTTKKSDSVLKPIDTNKLVSKIDTPISTQKKDSNVSKTPPEKKTEPKTEEIPINSEPHFTYEISFFEGDEVPTPESESADKLSFSQDSRYIYVHVKAKTDIPVSENTSITYHVKFYDRFGNLKSDRNPFTSFLSKGDFTDDFHSGFKQQWILGRYPVVVYINDIQQPTVFFTIE